MEQIVIVPNLLTKEICDKLISDANFSGTASTTPAFNYSDSIKIERRNFSEHHLIKDISYKFGFNVENAPMLWYPKNTPNPLHADNSIFENGSVIKVKNWKRSAIIFLNENFNGGELCYPEQGVCVKPKTGMMLVAPAGIEFPHLVTPADRDRYVLVLRII